MPLGLLSVAFQPEWFDSADYDVLVIENANLSDACAYAPALLSILAKRLIERTCSRKPRIVLSTATGPAALPWPADIELLSVRVDLETVERASTCERDADQQAQALHPLQRTALRAIQKQAEIEEAPKDVVRTLLALVLREQDAQTEL